MKKIRLALLLLPITIITLIIVLSPSSKDGWINKGDSFTINDEEFIYIQSYSNFKDGQTTSTNNEMYLEFEPVGELNRKDYIETQEPIPARAYAIDVSKNEIYTAEYWREDGKLGLKVKADELVYGVVYEDNDGNKIYFELFD